MKRFTLLLLFAIGCSLSGDDSVRWRNSLDELDYCVKWSSIGADQYGAMAQRAAMDGYSGAERLFRALSYVEQIHERGFIEALLSFGGEYNPTSNPILNVDSTPNNIQKASKQWYPRDHRLSERITIVINEGNRYVARLMIRHGASLNRRLREIECYMCRGDGETPHYLVCPRCGYMCDDHIVDSYCPQCYMPESTFRLF